MNILEASDQRISALLDHIHGKTLKKISLDDYWGIDTDGTDHDTQAWNSILPYERTFKNILAPTKNFGELAEIRRSVGRTAYFLDLFGSGKSLAETGKTNGVLGIRSKDIVEADEQSKRPSWWNVIEGNIYDLYPGRNAEPLWTSISTYLEAQGISCFDFIVCRPLGPFEHEQNGDVSEKYHSEDYWNIYYQLLKRFYSILSPNFGVLFTTVPYLRRALIVVPSVVEYLQRLGCECVVNEGDSYYPDRKDEVLRITKKPSSPLELPNNPECIKRID